MTTLMWEVAARADADVVGWVTADLWPWLARTAGYVDGEVYTSGGDSPRVVVIAHWADAASAAAVEAELGRPERQPDPGLVTRPPHVWAFDRLPGPGGPPC